MSEEPPAQVAHVVPEPTGFGVSWFVTRFAGVNVDAGGHLTPAADAASAFASACWREILLFLERGEERKHLRGTCRHTAREARTLLQRYCLPVECSLAEGLAKFEARPDKNVDFVLVVPATVYCGWTRLPSDTDIVHAPEGAAADAEIPDILGEVHDVHLNSPNKSVRDVFVGLNLPPMRQKSKAGLRIVCPNKYTAIYAESELDTLHLHTAVVHTESCAELNVRCVHLHRARWVMSYAFRDTEALREVVQHEDQVVHFGASCFVCSGIERIHIGKNCGYMGEACFESCTRLQQVTFESSGDEVPVALTVNRAAFKRCCSLRDIALPPRLTEIAPEMFRAAALDGTEVLRLPSSVSKVGEHAFCRSNLCAVDLPGVEVISAEAFSECARLVTATAPVCNFLGTYAFRRGPALREVSFPCLYKTGYGSFEACSLLTKVHMERLLHIGKWSFNLCRSLQEAPPSVITIAKRGLSRTGVTHVPAGVKSIGEEGLSHTMLREVDTTHMQLAEAVFKGSTLRRVVCGNTIVEDGTFQNCHMLEHIILTERVRCIGQFAFAKAGVGEPGHVIGGLHVGFLNVEIVRNNAFANANLKSVALNHGLRRIGDGAFSHTKISELTLPDSINFLGEGCFAGVLVKGVRIPPKIRHLPSRFMENAKLEHIDLNCVTSLGNYALAGTLLTQVNLAGVHKIDRFPFRGVEGLPWHVQNQTGYEWGWVTLVCGDDTKRVRYDSNSRTEDLMKVARLWRPKTKFGYLELCNTSRGFATILEESDSLVRLLRVFPRARQDPTLRLGIEAPDSLWSCA